MQLICQWERKT